MSLIPLLFSCRFFNDAINCFSEDGWSLMNADASDNVVMAIKRAKNYGVLADFENIICVKASLLLQVSFREKHIRVYIDFYA